MCIRDSSCGCGLPGWLRPRGPPPREAPLVRPPARFVVAIGFSAQNDGEPPGRGLQGGNLRSSPGPR
eukprot:11798859-Alexandrium_andersonii.AAC.1